MKKILSFILVFTLILSLLSIVAFASSIEEDSYTNFGKYLKEHGLFPEFGSYYYLQTGYDPSTPEIKSHSEIVIYLTNNASQDLKETIRSICTDFDVVTFKKCTNSFLFYEKLSSMLANDERIDGMIWYYSVSMSKDDTFLYMNVRPQYEETFKNIIDSSYSEYSSFVEIRYVDEGELTDATLEAGYELYPMPYKGNAIITTGDMTRTNNNSIYFIIAISSILLVGSIATIIIIQRRKKMRKITNNNLVVDNELESPIIQAIKDGEEPSDDLYEKIKDKL